MNLFLTLVFFYSWYQYLIYNPYNLAIIFEGLIIILCGLYQGTILDPKYWKEGDL